MTIQVDKKSELLVFRTDKKWTANNLKILLDSISKIYDILCKVNIEKERKVLFLLKRDEMEDIFPKEHAIKQDFVRMSLLLEASRTKDFSSPLIEKLFEKEIIPYSFKIHHIRMGSPGDISFEGIGEILKELRELLKDVLFRNKQEKMIGECKVWEQRFRMLEAYGKLSPKQKKILAKSTTKIKLLKKQGKITDVSGSIDF